MATYMINSEDLARHDDVCTDLLLSSMRFPCKIHRQSIHLRTPAPRVLDADVFDIVQQYGKKEKDEAAATTELMQLPPVEQYVDSLQSVIEVEQFQNHLASYLRSYAPDSRWELKTTRLYDVTRQETSVSAIRKVQKNHQIDYLVARLGAPTANDRVNLAAGSRDVHASVALNLHEKESQRCLGPARFINHDCDPNARLEQTSYGAVAAKATRNISAGEEITVSYGPNYFGRRNKKCRCRTCLEQHRNGWRPMHPGPPLPMRVLEKQIRQVWTFTCTPSYIRWVECTTAACTKSVLLCQKPSSTTSILCERCARHEEIYDREWPIRVRQPHGDSQTPILASRVSWSDSPRPDPVSAASDSEYQDDKHLSPEQSSYEDLVTAKPGATYNAEDEGSASDDYDLEEIKQAPDEDSNDEHLSELDPNDGEDFYSYFGDEILQSGSDGYEEDSERSDEETSESEAEFTDYETEDSFSRG